MTTSIFAILNDKKCILRKWTSSAVEFLGYINFHCHIGVEEESLCNSVQVFTRVFVVSEMKSKGNSELI